MLKNRIAAALKEMDKSGNWLAETAGIPKGLMSQIINGRSVPTTDELSLICGIIGKHREQLYGAEALRMIDGQEQTKKVKAVRKTKNVRITLPIIAIIDRYAKTFDLSRDEAIRQIVMIGVSVNERALKPRIVYEGWQRPLINGNEEEGGLSHVGIISG